MTGEWMSRLKNSTSLSGAVTAVDRALLSEELVPQVWAALCEGRAVGWAGGCEGMQGAVKRHRGL